MTPAEKTLTLIAGGDVGPVVEPVDPLVELALPVWRQADFRVAQCERSYSERGFYQQWKTTIPGGGHSRLHPRLASIWRKAEVDVVCLASNHLQDWGVDPLLDTLDLFHKMGVQTIGAGKNGAEAHKAAIVEKNGVKVAILGYCSLIRDGQAAGDTKPGITPMRATSSYEFPDFQPGAPPIITTKPVEEDLAALKDDVKRAKAQADAVVIFIHWGIRIIPKTLATYQPIVAHAAIDAGADVIIGHHPHAPKAVEVYRGKVCFYSIGNFLTMGSRERKPPLEWGLIWSEVEEDAIYNLPIHCKNTMFPLVTFSQKGVDKVTFLPGFINSDARPEMLKASDRRFEKVLKYCEWVSDYVPHQFRVEGDGVVVE